MIAVVFVLGFGFLCFCTGWNIGRVELRARMEYERTLESEIDLESELAELRNNTASLREKSNQQEASLKIKEAKILYWYRKTEDADFKEFFGIQSKLTEV